MKLLLLSDSHGNNDRLKALAQFIKRKGSFDYVVHAGDGVADLTQLDFAYPTYAVRGNCDFLAKEPEQTVLRIANQSIYISHGHLYRVKNSLDSLAKASKAAGCSIAIYGHTHQQSMSLIDSVYCINPGALNNGEFAILHLEEGNRPNPVFYQLP